MKKISVCWKYVIAAYIVFGAMVLVICGGASMLLNASPFAMRILSNVCAWSPTLVLFAAFKKWLPNDTPKTFLQRAFAGKLKAPLLLVSVFSTGLAFLLSALVYSLIKGVPFASLFGLGGYSVAASVILSLLSGPTGEECGWRGYLRPEFEKKYGFVKGNLLVGLVWTFWHTVLWFVDSDFTAGSELLIYVLANIVVITSIHLIIAVVLERENNLVYAVLIHLFFNLPYCFLNADISFYVIMTVVYALEAAAFLLYRNRKALQN